MLNNRVITIVFCLTVLVGQALADEYHYNNLLIGDRASGLGGAYTAISDDPSGLYYNPAGTVYSYGSNLSASMNAYHISRKSYKGVLGGLNWIRTSKMLVPNFFGVTQPLGPGTLGFSYAVTDSSLEDQDQTFANLPNLNDKFFINFNNQDQTYMAGPSYAFPINKKLSIGLTLYGYAHEREFISNQIFDMVDRDELHWENHYVATEEYGVKPILGFMYSPIDQLSLGLAISKITLLYVDKTQQSTCSSTYTEKETWCTVNDLTRFSFWDNNKSYFPIEIKFGATWFVSNSMLLTTSIDYYSPKYYGASATINVAAGMELYLSDTFAIRVGAYTNFANSPELVANVVGDENEHVDMFGGSLSFTSFTRSSSLTVGLSSTYGTGEAQIIGESPEIQDIVSMSLTAFMSAGYSY